MRQRASQISFVLLALALTGCATAPLRVTRVEFGGPIWSEGQRRAGVLFQDGAESIAVPGGTLWLFGDTFFGRPQPGQPPQRSQIKGAHGTTIAFLSGGQTNLPPALNYLVDAAGMATNPLSLFPDESSATYRMWPLGGIAIGGRVYLFYSMIEKIDGLAPWNFRGVSGGLAVAEKPLHSYARLRPEGRWQFPVEPIQVVREGDQLYLFELSSKPKGLILARVKAQAIENPAAYEFFNGQGWSNRRTDVEVMLHDAYGQVSIVWVPSRRCYLMATSSDFSRPREVQIRESRRLEGPWSAPVRIAVPELPGKKTTLVYGTFLHPELSDQKSRRFVATFCRALTGEWELSNPEWVTLTLAP